MFTIRCCTSNLPILLAVIMWVSTPHSVRADDWPNWSGVNHDGMSRETGFADAWPEGGLPIEWSCEIGIGFSSMSVVGHRLFAMGHESGVETVLSGQQKR